MKKLIFAVIVALSATSYSQTREYKLKKVSLVVLLAEPFDGDYAIIKKKHYEKLQKNERNFGQYDHVAQLGGEKDFNYWILHPENKNKIKEIVFSFNNDSTETKIKIKQNEVLIFKKGLINVPNWDKI